MRSPMCEALLNRAVSEVPTVTVRSAGLNAVLGRPAHPWAVCAAKEFGISLDNHRAQVLTLELVQQADAVFVMDYQNLAQLLRRYPSSERKAYMLGSYAEADQSCTEIPDPYYLDELGTRACYHLLDRCITNLVRSVVFRSAMDNRM